VLGGPIATAVIVIIRIVEVTPYMRGVITAAVVVWIIRVDMARTYR
jgi:hypothetical protein